MAPRARPNQVPEVKPEGIRTYRLSRCHYFHRGPRPVLLPPFPFSIFDPGSGTSPASRSLSIFWGRM